MLAALLVTIYIAAVALLGLLVAREYERFKVRRSWQQHSAFYGDTELKAPRFRPFFGASVCKDQRGESESADRATKNRQRVEEELLKAVRRVEGSV